MAFLEARCRDEVEGRYSTFFCEKTSQKFQENTLTLSCREPDQSGA